MLRKCVGILKAKSEFIFVIFVLWLEPPNKIIYICFKLYALQYTDEMLTILFIIIQFEFQDNVSNDNLQHYSGWYLQFSALYKQVLNLHKF